MIEPQDGSSPGRPWLVATLFVFVLIWIAWLRQPSLSTPIWNVDEGITAAIADEILAGGVPYRDATDLRAPLTYYLYAVVFAVAGANNMDAIHVAHTLLVMGTALMVLLVGRRISGLATGGWSLWLYAGLACCLFNPMDNFALHTEWPLAFCSGVGAWFFLTGHRRGGPKWLAGAGIFYGLAALSKQPALLDFGAPLVLQAWCLVSSSGAEARRHWRGALALVVGFVLPLALTVLYFAARGALQDFVFYTWTYNTRYYVPEVPLAARFPTVRVPLELLHQFAPSVLGLVALSLIVILYRIGTRRDPLRGDGALRHLFAPIWLLGGLGASTLSGRGFEHYSIQVLAPASLVAGQLLGPLTAWTVTAFRNKNWRLIPACVAIIALGTMTAMQIRHCLAYRAAIRPHQDPSVPMASIAREITTREDRLFVWGFYSDFHTLADRLPASRFVHGAFLTGLIPWTNLGRDTSYAVVPGSMENLIADLEKSQPRLIIDASPSLNRQFQHYPPEKFPPFLAYLRKHYIEYEPQRSVPRGWFHFYLRKDANPALPAGDGANSEAGPVVTVMNFGEDFSGYAKIAIHGSDPRGQLRQLGLWVGNDELKQVTFPPTSDRMLVVSLPYPVNDAPGSTVRIVARTSDERFTVSAPLSPPEPAEPPPDLHLLTPTGPVSAIDLSSAFRPVPVHPEGQTAWLCHAYTALRFPLPASAARLRFGYGLPADAYMKPSEHTDGVEFIIQLQPRHGAPHILHRRLLNPWENPADRGIQSGEVDIPLPQEGDSLVMITHPGPAYSSAYDWSYWTVPAIGSADSPVNRQP